MGKHDYNIEVDAATAQESFVAFVGAHKYGSSVTVDEIVAEQSNNADAEFNVTLDGSDLFSAEQSVTAADTAETFAPDQNKNAAGETVKITVEVSSAAGNAADQLYLGVTLDDGKGE